MKMVDKKSGAIVDVPDDKAQAAYMSGQFGVPKGAELPVVTEGGNVGTVAPKDAGKAFDAAARVADEPEYRAAQNEAKFGGVAGTAKATGLGAARGLAGSFGVPLDAAAVSLAGTGVVDARHEIDPYAGERTVSGADVARESLRGYQEAHPYASAAGELAGIAGAGYLGGGILGRVGAGAEALGGAALRGAAEGGVLGGIGSVNEAALGDTDLTASKVMAAVGHGALIGGALGEGLHLGAESAAGVRDRFGRWVGSLRPGDIDAVAERHFGFVPEGLGDKVRAGVAKLREGGISEGYSKVASAVSGHDAEDIARFTALTPEGAEARRIGVFDAPKIQEEAERAVRRHVDELMASGDLVSAEARGGLKASYVDGSVRRGNESEVQNFATKRMQTLIEGAEGQLGQEMAPSMLKSVETVSKLAYRAQEAIATGDNAAAFIALDNVKRGVQRLTSTGYRSFRAIADPVDQLNAKRTVAWLDGAAQDLRRGLEDTSVWGKAADDQRQINAAWTRQIDASKRFHKALTTEVGRDPSNPYIEMRGADPAKVSGYVKNLTNPNNDLTHKAVKDFVGSTSELSDAISKAYDLPADKVAEVARVKAAAGSFESTIGKAEKSLVTANQYQKLLEGPDSGSVAGALGTIGGVVGGLPGGILGTVAGAAMNAARRPGKVIAQMAAIERLSSKVDSEITREVSSFLSGGKLKGKPPAPASVEFLDGKGGQRKTFVSKVKEIQRLAANKEELLGNVEGFTKQFGDAAPNVAAALTEAAIKGVDYLARTAPPGFTPRPEALAWGIEEEPLYTDSEMREWARRAAVVNSPLEAVKSMKRKMLTPEEADALKNVHQPIFEQLQREFQKQRIEKPGNMPFGQALQVELMFDVPLNRSLEPGFMRTVQQSFAVPESKPPRPPSGPPSKWVTSTASQADAIRGA